MYDGHTDAGVQHSSFMKLICVTLQIYKRLKILYLELSLCRASLFF